MISVRISNKLSSQLICSYQSQFPAWFKALNGNQVDKTSFPETIQEYLSQMEGNDTLISVPHYTTSGRLKKTDKPTHFRYRIEGKVVADIEND